MPPGEMALVQSLISYSIYAVQGNAYALGALGTIFGWAQPCSTPCQLVQYSYQFRTTGALRCQSLRCARKGFAFSAAQKGSQRRQDFLRALARDNSATRPRGCVLPATWPSMREQTFPLLSSFVFRRPLSYLTAARPLFWYLLDCRSFLTKPTCALI